jgi:hypothetical protein
MGSEVSIDKHTTPLEEWLDVQDKLEGIIFEEEICPHVGAWKFFMDEVNPQEFNCLPVDIDLNEVHQLISPHETYVLYAIRD